MSARHTQTARTKEAAIGAPDYQLLALACAVGVLLITGWGHRVLIAQIDHALGQVVPPLRPLATLPLEVADWIGRDLDIDPRVREVAHFDDFYVNRIYANPQLRTDVGVFVGYVGRPRARLGHRPDVCFAAHGWEQMAQEALTVTSANGRAIPVVLYEFRSSGGFGNPMYVLATYIINGQFVQDPAAFKRWNTHAAQLFGERPAYQARLQVSIIGRGDRDETVRILGEFTGQFAEPLAELMPYWQEKAGR